MVTTFNEILHDSRASKLEEAQSEFARFASIEAMQYLEKSWLSKKNVGLSHL